MTPPRLLLVQVPSTEHGVGTDWRPNSSGSAFLTRPSIFPSPAEDDVAAVRNVIDSSDERDGPRPFLRRCRDQRCGGAGWKALRINHVAHLPDRLHDRFEQSVDFSGAPGISRSSLMRSRHPSIHARPGRSSTTVLDGGRRLGDGALRRCRRRLLAPPPPSPSWQVLPTTYIVCTDDRILSQSAQEQMAENADTTVRIDSDHSPFLSCPRVLGEVLSEIISTPNISSAVTRSDLPPAPGSV